MGKIHEETVRLRYYLCSQQEDNMGVTNHDADRRVPEGRLSAAKEPQRTQLSSSNFLCFTLMHGWRLIRAGTKQNGAISTRDTLVDG